MRGPGAHIGSERRIGRLPQPAVSRRHRLSFLGVGDSGRTEPTDVKRERAELAAKKYAEGV
jgi:hypothetical protein